MKKIFPLYFSSILSSCFFLSTTALAEPPTCPEKSVLTGAEPPLGFELYCKKSDGEFHGPYKKWYESGQLMLEQNYKNGAEHGEQKSWWPNGLLMMQGTSINGKRYRQFQYWDINGKTRKVDTEVVKIQLKQ